MLAVMIAGTAVLSRLLGPEAFGAFALAAAVFAVVEEVTQLGMPTLLTKLERLTARTARAAGGLVLALALAALAMVAIAWMTLALAGSTAGAEIAALVGVLVAGLTVKGIVMPVEAQLHRGLDFGVVSILGVVRATIDVGVAVTLALLGFGAFALAFGVLAERFLGGLLLLVLVRERTRVYLPSARGWRELFGFGGLFTASHAVGITGRFAIIATLFGVLGREGLGYYNRAQAVSEMTDRALLQGIKPVIMPLFRRSIDTGVPPAAIYTAKLDYLAVVLWPVFAVMVLLAEPLVVTVLGEKWISVVPAAQILLMGGLLIPFVRMSLKLFAVMDRLGDYLRVAVAYEPMRLVLVAVGAWLGGVEGAAAGMLLAAAIRAVTIVLLLRHRTGLRLLALAAPLARAALVAGCAVALAGAAAHASAQLPTILSLCAAVAGAAAGWIAGACVIRHPLIGDLVTLGRAGLTRIGLAVT